jgi:hypothetical protein
MHLPLLPVGTDYHSQKVILQRKNEDFGKTIPKKKKKKVPIAILPHLVHAGSANNKKMIIE